MSSATKDRIPIPEPALQGEEIIARAHAMIPILRARQEECEAAGRLLETSQTEFVQAGFYRLLQPRIFGGYEFSAEVFLKTMSEIARGCPSSGWVLALTAGHQMLISAFPLETQLEAYGERGNFMAPAASGQAKATRVEGGYEVSGIFDYVSGCDIATHFLGGVALGEDRAAGEPASILVLIDRAAGEIIDNWQVVGMQGTGSRRVVVDGVFVPDRRILRGAPFDTQYPVDRELLPNPMYHGRLASFLAAESAAVAVGIARGGLDLYEQLMRERPAPFSQTIRSQTSEYQNYYADACGHIDMAEATMLQAARNFMDEARRCFDSGRCFSEALDRRLILQYQHCVRMAWQAMDIVFTTSGTSSARRSSMLARYYKDFAVLRTHRFLQPGRTGLNWARMQFGLEPLTPV